MEKYYKVLTKNGESTHANFDYSQYLPKNGNAGKWLPEINDLEICERGYHITKYWNMWYKEGARIYEVEYKGMLTIQDHCGVEEKAVCKTIRLLRDATEELVPGLTGNRNTGYRNTGDYNTGNRNTGYCNTGNYNTGNYNTGIRNTGHCNTGDCNTGNRNTGDYNTGYRNTGDRNTGNYNTGDCNTGNWNTGYRNTGYRNTGNRNAGAWNTGDYNTGDYNTGDCNTGNRNTGDWNTGNYNTGYFNTTTPKVRIFNEETDLKFDDIDFPNWIYVNSPKKDAFREAFIKASLDDVEKTLKLPNFDYAIFEDITGISKSDFDKKLGK